MADLSVAVSSPVEIYLKRTDSGSIRVAQFSHEWLGECEFPVHTSIGPYYETDCGEPAIAKGTWLGQEPFHDQHMLLCPKHLKLVRDTEAEA